VSATTGRVQDHIDRRRVWRASVLGIWAAFFVWLWASGQVARFLGPRTYWVVVFGAVALTAACVAHLVTLRSPEPQPAPRLRELLGSAVLLAPIMVLIIVPRPELGALAASKKATASIAQAGSFLAPPQETGKLTFVDIHYANQSEKYAASRGITDGARVDLEGFVTHPAGTPDGDFQLTRFYVFCCAADAIPYSVTVAPGSGAATARDDTWLHIAGALRAQDSGYVLVPDKMEPVAEPKNPYLY
jgi:putative membrane protein